MELKLQTKHLKAALTHAAKNDVRYYLNGVHLEASQGGDLHIVATDGHRMFCGIVFGAADAASDFHAVTIPHDVVKRACARRDVVALTDRAGDWQLGDVFFKPVDGLFPDWRRIIPTGAQSAEPLLWNYDYLADAQAALRLWTGQKSAVIKQLQFVGVLKLVSTEPSAFAVVMPARAKSPTGGDAIFGAGFTPAAARS